MSLKINLCDSCKYQFATCPARGDDAKFGMEDNVIQCKKYSNNEGDEE